MLLIVYAPEEGTREEHLGGTIFIAGIDEAGRGPLAGPVTAACVVFPPGYVNEHIGDSKLLSAEKREILYEEIIRDALAYSVISVGPRRIELLNIRQATEHAMRFAAERVWRSLRTRFGSPLEIKLFIDGNMRIRSNLPQETIIQGDRTVMVIGAASILAKVTRDRLMYMFDRRFPEYAFATHKGYGTPDHLERLARRGPCSIHRRSFAGVKEFFAPPA